MRLIHWYLIGYFLLLIGGTVALWQAGAPGRVPTSVLLLAAIVAVGLGLVLAIVSAPASTRS